MDPPDSRQRRPFVESFGLDERKALPVEACYLKHLKRKRKHHCITPLYQQQGEWNRQKIVWKIIQDPVFFPPKK